MTVRFSRLFILSFTLLAGSLLLSTGQAFAYSNNDMIDDSVFDNTSSMSASQIQNLFNQYSGSCLKSYQAPDPQSWNSYGAMVSAAQVVKDASTMWGINPEVLLTTMQKEEGLVEGNGAYGCSPTAYWSAMGYDCPGSATYSYSNAQVTGSPNSYSGGVPADMQGATIGPTCVAGGTAVGFSAQVSHAAWQLEFGRQRSEGNGNLSWDGDNDIVFYGYMTAGTRARCQMTSTPVECNNTEATPESYSGTVTLNDSNTVTLANGATASLYSYTPYVQSFDTIFSNWFGDPTSQCQGTSNVTGAKSGFNFMGYQYGTAPEKMIFTIMNNTGSTCTEAHVWAPGFSNWMAHYATGMKATDPSTGTLVASKSAVDNQESLNFILYKGSGGNVEIHRMSPNLQKLPGYYDVATNLGSVTATSGMFVAGDFMGRGYDQLVYVLYNGSSGKVEIHMFNPAMTSAIGYYDVATNLPSGDVGPTTGTFVAGDFLHKGYDQLAYVLYSDNTGNAEVHVFDPTLTRAIGYYDVKTNLTGVSATSGEFVGGDFLGRGYDQLEYMVYDGSSGMVEAHMFNPSLTSAIGFQDLVTNLNGVNPND
jgi:hypothetical protein